MHTILQDVYELCDGVALLHDDLLGPVSQHAVAVLHAAGHRWRQDLQSLLHYAPSLQRMSLQQAVEHL